MKYNGKEVKTLLKNTYKNGIVVDSVPEELCEYKDYIVYCNYFGLFLIDKQSGEKIKINNIKGTRGLCVFDDTAYYDHSTDIKHGVLMKSSLTSRKTEKIEKPFKDEIAIDYIYPTKNNIILSSNREVWYYLDNKNELRRINFYNNTN